MSILKSPSSVLAKKEETPLTTIPTMKNPPAMENPMLEAPQSAFYADENGTLHAAITMHDIGCLLTTHLMQRLFAVIDAAMTDEQPKQATKELVQHILCEAHSNTRQWIIDRANGLHADFPYRDSRTITTEWEPFIKVK